MTAIHDYRELIRIAHAANPPDYLEESGVHEDRTYDSIEGWKVVVFYDASDLDYISHFITPAGEQIDFWEWPEETPGRNLLIAWRSTRNTERLLKANPI